MLRFITRNIPKKVPHYMRGVCGVMSDYCYCPVCHSDLEKVEFLSVSGKKTKKHSYCWSCGQKLDWERRKGGDENDR